MTSITRSEKLIPANGGLPDLSYVTYTFEGSDGPLEFTLCSNGDRWLEHNDHPFNLDKEDIPKFLEFLKLLEMLLEPQGE